MNRVLASFTRSEKNIIAFVLALVAVGYAMLEYQERQREVTVFTTKNETQADVSVTAPLVEGLGRNGLVDINSAGKEVLETLPGVGPSLADAILRQRTSRGPFHSLTDLDAIPGVGPAMLEKLAPAVDFGTSVTTVAPQQATPSVQGTGGIVSVSSFVPASPMEGQSNAVAAAPNASPNSFVNINTAGPEELDSLDGVGPALAKRIIEDRQRSGPFRTADSLMRVKGIGPTVLRKNNGRIRVQ